MAIKPMEERIVAPVKAEKAYAIKSITHGKIQVETVSLTQRGAIVNFLKLNSGHAITRIIEQNRVDQEWLNYISRYALIEVIVGPANLESTK